MNNKKENNQIDNKTEEFTDFGEDFIRLLKSSEKHFLFVRNIESQKADFYSGSFSKITGYNSKEVNQFPGKFLHLIVNEDLREVKDTFYTLGNNPEDKNYSIEYRIIRKNGNVIWLQETGRVKIGAKTNGIQTLGIVTDITEHRIKNEELKELVKHKEQLIKSKDKLISIVSHDLRAPFTSLLGFSEILLNENDLTDHEKQEYLEYIYDASKSQLQLINYLLDWSRLQTGKMRIEPRRLNIKDVIANCISVLTGAAIRKNIEIITKINDVLYINADERLISQAITNLISNAIKFTMPGKNIFLRVNKFKEKMIEIIVKDEGIGISEKNMTKIFKIDEKLSLTGTMGEKGTGLGLALVKEIVEKHNGQIWFYSKEGEGSEFHFTLPEANDLILIVETDSELIQQYKNIIYSELPKFDILFVDTGFEAINLANTKIPSMIIVRHHMSLLTGSQLVETIKKKERFKNLPVVITSSNLDSEIKQNYIQLGVKNFLELPFQNDKLIDILKNSFN